MSFVWLYSTGGRSFVFIYSGAAFHCNLSACRCATRLFERTGEGDPRSSAKDRLQSRPHAQRCHQNESESVAPKERNILAQNMERHTETFCLKFKCGFVPKDIRNNTHFTMDLTYL